MEKIDFINNILKFLFADLCIYFIFNKITNIKVRENKKFYIIFLCSFILSIVYSYIDEFIKIRSFVILPILYFVYSIILGKVSNNKLNFSVSVTTISIFITYVGFLLSIIISSFIIKILFRITNCNSTILLILAMLIEIIVLKIFFNINRFKNGFNFLKDSNKIEKIGFVSIIFWFSVLIINTLFDYGSPDFIKYLVITLIIILIFFIIWIKRQITQKYIDNMKNRTIEIQNQEIEDYKNEIEHLKDINLKMSEVIHKYNNRLNALENSVIRMLNDNIKFEVAEELSVTFDDLKNMSKEFSTEISEINSCDNEVDLTNIMSIDNLFEYMSDECRKNNIKFSLKVNNSIRYLIENIISKSDFETIIGDHIKDAIIAINSNNSEKRKIMCILGIIDNCYEFCIYDTGIEFEIDTLLKLGINRVTTHKDEGGSGIGFMTTFKALKKCRASLIIEEYKGENNYYTKCLIFRFDGKNQYKICSYRFDEIRVIVEEINKNN